ncbi:MAG: DUF3710 domain-containing protein [Mycobacterium sp.]
MAFGKRRRDKNEHDDAEPVVSETAAASDDAEESEENFDGPFEIEDFYDEETAALGRLDLGSVLIPMPEAGQVQVELNQTGVPSAVWLTTKNGRYTVAAYAAPKSAGLWREVATELAESLRKDKATVTIEDGPWGREVVGIAAGAVRFIGIDGYRWMIRCVVNSSHETFGALTEEARTALADTVVRRGDTPLPVRTPLPVTLPEPMAAQLRAAAAAQASGNQQAQQAAGPQAPAKTDTEAEAKPVARRSASGSAMQQLRTITGG